MKTLTQQLIQYARYHRDRRNIATHLVGVPMIVLAVTTLLSRPVWALGPYVLNPAMLVALVVCLYYLRLDRVLGLLMAVLLSGAVVLGQQFAAASTAVWLGWGLGLFVVGWIIQFIGHAWEGRKPAFVDDLIGLLIGPLFVLAELGFWLGLGKALQARIVAEAGPTRVGSLRGATPAGH
jgi:uncharacterized membrane protein YGL010W